MPPATDDSHSAALRDLQSLDVHTVVSNFIKSNKDHPLVGSIVSLLDAIKANADLQRLTKQLLNPLIGLQLYNGLLNAIKAHVEAHPWATAFFIVGVVLMCHPAAIAGFRALGPVADSLATVWQSTVGGTAAAQSAFGILQNWGNIYSVVIPVAGAVIAAGQDAWVIANAGGQEVGRWNKGEYGTPVTQWWNGAYGDPVTRWWKGDYGAPVTGWANSVVRK